MRSIAATLQYIFKNFLFIFVFALIPSYFFAASLDLENIRALAQALLSAENPEFLQVFSFLSFVNARGWVFSVICLILLVICLPLLFGFIEKHMRIGSRSFKGIWGRFNTNFLSTLVVGVLFLAMYELWALIASGLIYGSTLMFSDAAGSVAAVLVYFVMLALISYLASIFLLWLPCLLITGYNFMDALSYSNQLYAGKKGGLFLAVFVPGAVSGVVTLLVVGVFAPMHVQMPVFLIEEILFLLLMLYYSALMFVAYFRLTGEERADLQKKF